MDTRRTAPRDTAGAPHRLAVPVGLLVALALVALDQATKVLAERLLVPGRFVPLVGDHVGWQLVYNPGGAFGIGAPPWIFLVVTVLVVGLVARALPRCRTLTAATAYGMLLAGALGNVIDRLLRSGAPDGPAIGGGYVVDFVAWGSFPRFNVADSAITVGFVLLVLVLWHEDRRATRGAAADGAGAGEDRGGGDPAAPDAGDSGPAAPDPDAPDPAAPDAGDSGPAATDSAATDPAAPDPDAPDPGPEPGRPAA